MDLFERLQEALTHLDDDEEPELSLLDSTASAPNLARLQGAVRTWQEGRRTLYLAEVDEVLARLGAATRQLWHGELPRMAAADPLLAPLLDSTAYLLDELHEAVQGMRDALSVEEAEQALTRFHGLLEQVDRVEQEVRRAA